VLGLKPLKVCLRRRPTYLPQLKTTNSRLESLDALINTCTMFSFLYSPSEKRTVRWRVHFSVPEIVSRDSRTVFSRAVQGSEAALSDGEGPMSASLSTSITPGHIVTRFRSSSRITVDIEGH
jgi:hypothetical protein